MPYRPPRPCPAPGCPRLVAVGEGACPEHRRPAWQRSRPRRLVAGSGWAWGRLRQQVLARDGHRCRYCGAAAEVVDHIVGVAAGGTDDMNNLAACCRACNERKRRAEAQAGRQGRQKGET